jgi:hypothetical protein
MHGEFHALAVPIKGGAQIGPQKPRQENVCSIQDVLKDKENISSHAYAAMPPSLSLPALVLLRLSIYN